MKEFLMQLNEKDMKKLKQFREKMTKYRIAKREMKEGVWVQVRHSSFQPIECSCAKCVIVSVLAVAAFSLGCF